MASSCGEFTLLDAHTIVFQGNTFVLNDTASPGTALLSHLQHGNALGHDPSSEGHFEFGTSEWWMAASFSLAIVLCAGLVAGLTMGLVSLDGTYIDILAKTGTAAQRKQSKKVKWFVKRHHLVLVTLLLANSLCNEALPLFLNRVVPESLSIVLSVTLVLLFGEILPSAIFTGPNQLKIAAAMTYVVWFFITIFFILSWPISKILDKCLGEEHEHRYRRKELKEFIKLHGEGSIESRVTSLTPARHLAQDLAYGTARAGADADIMGAAGAFVVAKQASRVEPGGGMQEQSRMESHLLTHDEVTIISGALDLKGKAVRDCMVPIDEVFMLSSDDKMDRATMNRIISTTHSRIPVYRGTNRNDIMGLMIVKLMIKLDPDDRVPVSQLDLRSPLVIDPNTPMFTALNMFQTGVSHMALVSPQADTLRNCLECNAPTPANVVRYT